MEKLRIAVLGTRGIPAAYGGFETFAEELSTRLSQQGHRVTVYGRRSFFQKSAGPEQYRGVQCLYSPTVMHKYLETPLHALTSFLDLFRRRFDVVLLCNAANAPFSWLVRLRRIPFAINVDGIERNRSKWNAFGRLWYQLGERCAVLFANRIIADAKVIAEYFEERFRVKSAVIAYGARVEHVPPGETLREFSLEKDKYILYVSRLEPENNALGVISAYKALNTDLPLVVVGDAPYAEEYKNRLRAEAQGTKVVFTGFRFGKAYQELRSNCYCYVQATEVGGTHPALVEAMAYGNCVIANDVPEHREVLADTGMYYPKNDFAALTEQLQLVLADESLRHSLACSAAERARALYSWDTITEQYEALFHALCNTAQKTGQVVEIP